MPSWSCQKIVGRGNRGGSEDVVKGRFVGPMHQAGDRGRVRAAEMCHVQADPNEAARERCSVTKTELRPQPGSPCAARQGVAVARSVDLARQPVIKTVGILGGRCNGRLG